VIAVIIGLLLLAQPAPTYTGALSYADLEQVVKNRQWHNTQYFDILLAVPDCADLGKWADVEIKDGPTLLGIIVDCENPQHAGQLEARGLAADCNLPEWVHWQAEIRVR
jgi:hypothetical protein